MSAGSSVEDLVPLFLPYWTLPFNPSPFNKKEVGVLRSWHYADPNPCQQAGNVHSIQADTWPAQGSCDHSSSSCISPALCGCKGTLYTYERFLFQASTICLHLPFTSSPGLMTSTSLFPYSLAPFLRNHTWDLLSSVVHSSLLLLQQNKGLFRRAEMM